MRLKVTVTPFKRDLEYAKEEWEKVFGYGSVVCIGTEHIYIEIPTPNTMDELEMRVHRARLTYRRFTICGFYLPMYDRESGKIRLERVCS